MGENTIKVVVPTKEITVAKENTIKVVIIIKEDMTKAITTLKAVTIANKEDTIKVVIITKEVKVVTITEDMIKVVTTIKVVVSKENTIMVVITKERIIKVVMRPPLKAVVTIKLVIIKSMGQLVVMRPPIKAVVTNKLAMIKSMGQLVVMKPIHTVTMQVVRVTKENTIMVVIIIKVVTITKVIREIMGNHKGDMLKERIIKVDMKPPIKVVVTNKRAMIKSMHQLVVMKPIHTLSQEALLLTAHLRDTRQNRATVVVAKMVVMGDLDLIFPQSIPLPQIRPQSQTVAEINGTSTQLFNRQRESLLNFNESLFIYNFIARD